MSRQITIAYGDGIGYEIMSAALEVMREAGAKLDIEAIQMGEESYRLGDFNGFDGRALRSIKRTGVLLKAPTIDPSLIQELSEYSLTPASTALYAALELPEQKTHFIYQDAPEFSAISSIGDEVAVFETPLKHDDKANPAGMIFAATHMLRHIGQSEVAEKIQNSLTTVLENGGRDNLPDVIIADLNKTN